MHSNTSLHCFVFLVSVIGVIIFIISTGQPIEIFWKKIYFYLYIRLKLVADNTLVSSFVAWRMKVHAPANAMWIHVPAYERLLSTGTGTSTVVVPVSSEKKIFFSVIWPGGRE